MRYYDIEIKDAYIAINTNRPQGFDLPVVFLELDSKIFLDILPALKREAFSSILRNYIKYDIMFSTVHLNHSNFVFLILENYISRNKHRCNRNNIIFI